MSMNEELDEVARKPGALELIRALQDITAKIERRPRLVAAIADPSTTHEAFYAMLFGEVDHLVQQLKDLEKTLPELNRDLMVSAMSGISSQLDPVFEQAEENIKKQLQETLAACEKSSQTFTLQMVRFEQKARGLGDMNFEQLSLDIRNAVEVRERAVEAMQKASSTFNAAAKRLDDAATRIENGRASRMVAVVMAILFAGLIGGGVGAFGFSMLSNHQAQSINQR